MQHSNKETVTADEIVGSTGTVLSAPGAVINDGFTVTYTGP